jgi:hypothetical protein
MERVLSICFHKCFYSYDLSSIWTSCISGLGEEFLEIACCHESRPAELDRGDDLVGDPAPNAPEGHPRQRDDLSGAQVLLQRAHFFSGSFATEAFRGGAVPSLAPAHFLADWRAMRRTKAISATEFAGPSSCGFCARSFMTSRN